MPLNQPLINEITREAQSTRKMLERLADEKFGWKPHEKSMTLQRLASHVADLPSWISLVINANELDLAGRTTPYYSGNNITELLAHHDKMVAEGNNALQTATDEHLLKPWTLRSGDHIILTMPRIACLRHLVNNHLYHHRGQLSVYLRLLDIPVPGMFGPSADEM